MAPSGGPPVQPGSYLLVLRLDGPRTLSIGQLGPRRFDTGWHVYAGSARGGLRARLAHHLRPIERPRWHIDYLRQAARLAEVWVSLDQQVGECALAEALAALPGASRCLKFGSSDCGCSGHLVSLRRRPNLRLVSSSLQRLESW